MAVTILVNGIAVVIQEQSPKIQDTLDGRSIATFTILDTTGLVDYQPAQTVSISDSISGYSYTGYIASVKKTNLSPSTTNLHETTCIDGDWIPSKRYYTGIEYENHYSGDIATDLLNNTLAAEGITAAYATRNDQTATQWNAGTLSSVIGTNNISGGDLELTSGTPISITETGSTFNTGLPGTMNVTAAGALAQNSYSAIKMIANQTLSGAGNTYTYVKIWSGSYVIPTDCFFEYDLFVLANSPEIKIALDFVCTDGTTLRDYATEANDMFDLQDMSPHPQTDLSGLANNGTWYHREHYLLAIVGKTVSYISISCEGDKTGVYTGYVRSVFFGVGLISRVVSLNIFTLSQTTLNTNQQLQNYGYVSSVVSVAKCFNPVDTRFSQSYSLSSASVAASTFVSWLSNDTSQGATVAFNSLVPTDGTKVAISYSIDGGVAYIPCVNNMPLPDFPKGINVSGESIKFKQSLYSSQLNPEATPVLNSLSLVVAPGSLGTKTDINTVLNVATPWNAGTYTNTAYDALNNQLILANQSIRGWDDGNIGSQTKYGSGTPQLWVKNKTLLLGTDVATDVRSQMVFAGNFQNFIMEVDMVVSTNVQCGFVWRTTNWNNTNGTFAYTAMVTPTQVTYGYGSNSGSTNSYTSLAVAAVTLVSGQWHRFKIVVNGTSCLIYLDDVLMISKTDSTYTATGGVALRVYSDSGHIQTLFDNFGVTPVFTGTWLSPSTSLNSLAAYFNSDFYYLNTSSDNTNCTILAEYTINGGSTWTTIIEPGVLPGITYNQSLLGVSIQYRLTLTTTTASALPAVQNVMLKILGSFSGSGNRISPSLSLSGVGRAGSTLISWSGIQPTNTTILVDSSLDLVTWTNIGGGAVGSGNIAGITTQADPYVDLFGVNTSSSYTSTYATGGSLATWVWDTAHNRLTVSGGSQSLLIYNSATYGADVDVSCIMDISDHGGLAWRQVDQSNFYSISVHDNSAASIPGTIQLFKTIAGTLTQIGSNIAINFVRNTPYTLEASHVGSALNLYFNGVNVLSIVESSLSSAGYAGVRNNTSSGSSAQYYQLRIQFYGDNLAGKQVFSRVRLTSTDPTATPQLTNLVVSAHDASIQNGALIPLTNYSIVTGNKKTISGIYDDLSKQSGNYWWRVKAKKLSFQAHTAISAPWAVTGNDILVQNISIETANDVYRNSQWGNGAIDIQIETRSFIGDGTKTTFDLGFTLDSLVSVTLNGVTQVTGVKSVDTGKSWYYKKGDSNVVQDTNNIPINSLQTLTVTFYAQVNISSNIQSPSEISRIASIDGTTGIVDEGEDFTGLSKVAMLTKMYGLLQRNAVNTKIIKFDTLRGGLAVGNLICVFSSPFNVFAGTFLITDISIVWKQTSVNGVNVLQPWYSVSATNGAVIGDWTRFVAQLGTP